VERRAPCVDTPFSAWTSRIGPGLKEATFHMKEKCFRLVLFY